MELGLGGRHAVVTGGSRGIGKEIARALAREGVHIAIAARSRQVLEESAAELAAETGQRIIPIVADMTEDASVDAMVAAAAHQLGGIDILVNNAAAPGGRKVASIADVRVAELLDDINVKVGGYLRAARAVAPYMVAKGWGRIINIGGLAARLSGNYSAAIRSVSVSALTKNLADELGSAGIGVVAIHPGAMRSVNKDPEWERRFAAASSNGKLFDISAIAWLVTILCSPNSVAINGETLQAGGGIKGFINY